MVKIELLSTLSYGFGIRLYNHDLSDRRKGTWRKDGETLKCIPVRRSDSIFFPPYSLNSVRLFFNDTLPFVRSDFQDSETKIRGLQIK